MHLNQNSASPYAPAALSGEDNNFGEKVLTDAESIDANGDNQANSNPHARVGSRVPETDESCRCRQLGWKTVSTSLLTADGTDQGGSAAQHE